MIKARMSTKVKGRIGPGPKDDKTMRVLNRIVEWTDTGIKYESDQRHAEIIIDHMGLTEKGKSTVSPGDGRYEDEGEEVAGQVHKI